MKLLSIQKFMLIMSLLVGCNAIQGSWFGYLFGQTEQTAPVNDQSDDFVIGFDEEEFKTLSKENFGKPNIDISQDLTPLERCEQEKKEEFFKNFLETKQTDSSTQIIETIIPTTQETITTPIVVIEEVTHVIKQDASPIKRETMSDETIGTLCDYLALPDEEFEKIHSTDKLAAVKTLLHETIPHSGKTDLPQKPDIQILPKAEEPIVKPTQQPASQTYGWSWTKSLVLTATITAGCMGLNYLWNNGYTQKWCQSLLQNLKR